MTITASTTRVSDGLAGVGNVSALEHQELRDMRAACWCSYCKKEARYDRNHGRFFRRDHTQCMGPYHRPTAAVCRWPRVDVSQQQQNEVIDRELTRLGERAVTSDSTHHPFRGGYGQGGRGSVREACAYPVRIARVR